MRQVLIAKSNSYTTVQDKRRNEQSRCLITTATITI